MYRLYFGLTSLNLILFLLYIKLLVINQVFWRKAPKPKNSPKYYFRELVFLNNKPKSIFQSKNINTKGISHIILAPNLSVTITRDEFTNEFRKTATRRSIAIKILITGIWFLILPESKIIRIRLKLRTIVILYILFNGYNSFPFNNPLLCLDLLYPRASLLKYLLILSYNNVFSMNGLFPSPASNSWSCFMVLFIDSVICLTKYLGRIRVEKMILPNSSRVPLQRVYFV